MVTRETSAVQIRIMSEVRLSLEERPLPVSLCISFCSDIDTHSIGDVGSRDVRLVRPVAHSLRSACDKVIFMPCYIGFDECASCPIDRCRQPISLLWQRLRHYLSLYERALLT